MRTPAVALALLLALPASSGAAARPQLTDPTGDLLPVMSPGYDVVSALFATSGITERAGRRSVYTPDTLVVTVTYAGAVPADPAATQAVVFAAPGCDDVYLQRWVDGARGYAGCTDRPLHVTADAAGRTVTFRLRFKQLGPRHLYRGAVLTGLRTYTALAEPVFGNESGDQIDAFGAGPVDSTRVADASYRVR